MSQGTYTIIDKKDNCIVVTIDSNIINKVHKARQQPLHYKFIHRILTKVVYKLHRFLDSDFFYKQKK